MHSKFFDWKRGAACLALSLAVSPLFADNDADAAKNKLAQIIDGEHRSAANQARDVYRHPLETLLFFGLRDDMHVVEIAPGGGWYTEIIAPYVNERGQYYGAGADAESPQESVRAGAARFKAKLAEHPELYGNAIVTELAPPHKTAIAPAGSADMVLTFRNVHNWLAAGTADQVFAAMYQALKPGGILGVVEHRGKPEVEQDPKAKSGYVNEAYVIDLAKKAGFELVEKSEINANPKDSKDYEGGVWTLPPTLRLKEQDRERYLAIGESDRMTLKFVKPIIHAGD